MTTTDISVSAELKKAISIAQAIAKENLSSHFAPPHLLKALLHKDVGLQNLLLKINADVYYLEEWAEVRIEMLPKSNAPKETVPAHEDVHTSMEEADSIRLALNKNEIEPFHLLIALSTPGVGFSFDQLKTYPLRRDFLMSHAMESAGLNDILQTADGQNGQANGATTLPGEKTGQALLKYCTEKTLLARGGKLDPITGREQEIRMMSEILSRRSKPNVMITGEPGVGKSALVDGFALAVTTGQVPAFLLNAKVFELDNGALIAGASYKGEIEDRLKSIIKEIKQHEKAVLFIDEIHTLLDKGGAVAGAANLLKPELSRGAITLIGATTLDEYRKHVEPDEAFARRFELLQVAEPDAATAFRMMKIVMPYYVAHHGIELPDDTLHESIRLAARFMKDRRLPDSAIDLADRSMAALRLAIDTGAETIAQHKKELDERGEGEEISLDDLKWHYLQLKNKLSPILWSEITTEDDPLKFAEAAQLQSYLQGAYERLEKLLPIERKTLEKHDIASIVADKTGIPVGKLQAQETERLLNMPATLKQRVVGQDYAISSISEAILESRSGLAKAGQPIGSFFFLGPTGTGKTELAKALAEQMFQNENFMIRFDMSEFKEEHSAALLYGAPPGYVGYEEGGLLINKIRQQPYAVVLFDEIEKAHHSVFDIFLQIMDEGKLNDKLGKAGDFSNAIIIFTSNIGSQYVTDSINNGKIPSSTELLEIMAKHFRPEFLGRLTEIVPFSPMKLEMVENILNIQLAGLYSLLQKQGITLHISPEAKTVLAKMGFTPQYGARPLAGVIRSQIRRPLSRKIISKELEAGKEIKLVVDEKGTLIWQ
jgi:ATP-dependent Clp protease ATP-binding subunit ClpB